MKGILMLVWLVCYDSNPIVLRLPEEVCERARGRIEQTIWYFDRTAISKCLDEEATTFLDYREPWDYCFP